MPKTGEQKAKKKMSNLVKKSFHRPRRPDEFVKNTVQNVAQNMLVKMNAHPYMEKSSQNVDNF
jgi:hypothetical protein